MIDHFLWRRNNMVADRFVRSLAIHFVVHGFDIDP